MSPFIFANLQKKRSHCSCLQKIDTNVVLNVLIYNKFIVSSRLEKNILLNRYATEIFIIIDVCASACLLCEQEGCTGECC